MASPGIGHSDYIRWGALFMLSPLITIPVGVILGVLAGLGVGGGTLLILWLTLIADTASVTARAINLMFFLVAAGSVSLFRYTICLFCGSCRLFYGRSRLLWSRVALRHQRC